MHFTYFSVKRVYWQAMNRVQKPMMGRFGLTPARFDALYILSEVSRGDHLRQSAIRKELGISRATISRMLKSLEALGFVARKKERHGDTRQVEVSLTVVGRAWMKRVLHWLRLGSRGPVERTTHSIFVEKWWSASDCLRELEAFQTLFGRLSAVLMDGATLYYPWHPDD